jgi:hypothetical protein
MLLDDAELERQLRETLNRAATPVLGEGVDEDAVRQEVERRRVSRPGNGWGGRLMLATLAAAAVAAVAFMVTRPGEDDVEIGPSNNPDRVTTTVPEPETTLPEPTTPSTTTPTSTTEATTTTTSSTVPPLPEFPAEMGVMHGQPAWGLYLAIAPDGESGAPQMVAAIQAKADAGYGDSGGYSDLGCDQGAAEVLGVDPSSFTVAAYYETEAIANQAREAFEARGTEVVGIAFVRTYCLD